MNESCREELVDCAQVAGAKSGRRAFIHGGKVFGAIPPEFYDLAEVRRAWLVAYIKAYDAAAAEFVAGRKP